jgi:cytochrome c oxidase subunit 2
MVISTYQRGVKGTRTTPVTDPKTAPAIHEAVIRASHAPPTITVLANPEERSMNVRALLLSGIVMLATAAGVSAPATVGAEDANVIALTASNWKFSPEVVEAHAGQTITLKITSSAGLHGIQSDDLGIPNTMLPPGKTVTITFTPAKAGKYVVRCSVPCGPGHGAMTFTVKVED